MLTIKRLSFLVLMLLMVGEILAQLTIKAGINASSRRASFEGASFETNSKIGFHVGGTYTTTISDKFLFKPGLLYSQKGASFGDAFDNEGEVQNYIEIPLTVVYQSNPEEGFFAEAGPYLGYLISANLAGQDIKNKFNSTDFGINLGLGYDFGKLLIGLRGGLGIANVEVNDGNLSTPAVTNNSGQIYLGFKL